MTDTTVTRWVTVTNVQGLHARPADLLVKAASCFHSKIDILKNGEPYDAKSILSVMTLAAVQGSRLQVRASGDDAGQAVDTLAELFERAFEEPAGPDAVADSPMV